MVKLHVLFADDDDDIREIFALSLRRDAFFVLRGCTSGGEALKNARDWRPDLVLLDVKMPGMDGPTVLARLRADKHTAAIPVVFVTASTQPRECARLKSLGAAGVIKKPFDPVELAAQLRRFVPFEGVLATARDNFLLRLDADACALSTCRRWLSQNAQDAVLTRIGEIAHTLAGAAGIYGFAGITREAAELSEMAENCLAGSAATCELLEVLDRLIDRIGSDRRPMLRSAERRERRLRHRYSVATV
jgi:two-component system, OmpR family, response regulator